MPPQDSLGNSHHAINKRTNETVQSKIPFADVESLKETCDADRLYKIDVAAKYKYVPYIIENLKSGDDLYVARALKKSPWLFTNQYADIINPEYLENELFPFINSRSVSKIKLEIRLKLKDEHLSEQFYKHLKTKKQNEEALKWLPLCSTPFIEETVLSEWKNIDKNLFKRLCENTVRVFEVVMENLTDYYRCGIFMRSAMFLLYSHTDIFLDCYEKLSNRCRLQFNKHATRLIVTKSLNRFKAKLHFYIRSVDLNEVGKHLNGIEVKELLLDLHRSQLLRGWFSYENLRPLFYKLAKEESFDFAKKLFIDKSIRNQVRDNYHTSHDCVYLSYSRAKSSNLSMGSVYKCYATAPFALAFEEMKKLIRTESSSEERIAMLKVLIASSGKSAHNLYLLVLHFRKYHINEPAIHKNSFVQALLKSTDGYLYEERTWKLLNDIVHSLEVYNNENCTVSEVVFNTIVSRCLIQNAPIHELVQKRFMKNFSTLKQIQKHLDETSKERIYNFLRSQLQTELDAAIKDKNKQELMAACKQILNLMKDWNKHIVQDAKIMHLLKDLMENNSNDVNLVLFYNTEKKWRRDLFEYSLKLVQTKDAFVNAMKHKPDMILKHRESLDKIIESDSINLDIILKKMRVYFPDKHGADMLKYYDDKLQKCRKENVGYKAVTRGVCILMHRDMVNEIIKGFVPDNYKIKWSEEDPALINIRKYLAQQMYHVRPTVQIETILLFAKGDYLQYAISSLLSVCSRKSRQEIKTIIPLLIGSVVSLQKHGIRLVFSKLSYEEIDQTFRDLWDTTKNASIRAVIFESTHKLLCNEESDSEACWKLLKCFMESINHEEDRTIYVNLTNVENVPASMRGEFCKMGFKILNSLPPKNNCESLTKSLFSSITSNMEHMDRQFVEQLILDFTNEMNEKTQLVNAVHKGYSTPYANLQDVIAMITEHILCCHNEYDQLICYNNVLKRIIEECMVLWNVRVDNKTVMSTFCKRLIFTLIDDTVKRRVNIKNTKNDVNPKAIFEDIRRMAANLNVEENYEFLTKLKLCLEYCHTYESLKSKLSRESSQNTEEFYKVMGGHFGKSCISILKKEIEKHFPSVNVGFAKILKDFTTAVDIKLTFHVLDVLTDDSKDIQANMLAVHILPEFATWCYDENRKKNYHRIFDKLSKLDNKEIILHVSMLAKLE